MLRFFSIRNLAVINHLSFDLHSGLNLLTGETGTGKSIIIDALGLLLGGRGGSDLIRSGERVAIIEGLFELQGAREVTVREVLMDAGVVFEEGDELLIRREIQSRGRSRIFVNEQSVTAATLRAVQPFLLEILGQGEHHTLAVSKSQLEMLDEFAGCEELRHEVACAYEEWKSSVEALEILARDEGERDRVGDFLRFQISEIERAALRAGEDAELTAEKMLLVHAEKALELCADGYAELYESDRSVLTRLAAVGRHVKTLLSIDGRVTGWLESLETATLIITDVAEGLRRYGAGVDFSPERLNEIESRLAELDKLKRKYGRDEAGLLRLVEELRAQLGQLETCEQRRAELARRIEVAQHVYIPLARRLSAVRRAAVSKLEARVMKELSQVAMENARFVVVLETAEMDDKGEVTMPKDSSGGFAIYTGEKHTGASAFWSPNGVDRVEFFLSANVGEDPKPLARIASGGELSRMMLTLRVVCRGMTSALGRQTAAGTMIFDEIDTGIGGKTAEAVGRRLQSLAAHQQVLCVTHQAQIARFADHHYAVSKSVENGRTLTTVHELEGERRIGELARMIGGAEEVETTRETARWMLEQQDAAPIGESAARTRRRTQSSRRAPKHH